MGWGGASRSTSCLITSAVPHGHVLRAGQGNLVVNLLHREWRHGEVSFYLGSLLPWGFGPLLADRCVPWPAVPITLRRRFSPAVAAAAICPPFDVAASRRPVVAAPVKMCVKVMCSDDISASCGHSLACARSERVLSCEWRMSAAILHGCFSTDAFYLE